MCNTSKLFFKKKVFQFFLNVGKSSGKKSFLGVIPLELSDMYPASHYETPRKDFSPEDFPTFKKNWDAFFLKNNFDILHAPKSDDFLKPFVNTLPKSTKRKFF